MAEVPRLRCVARWLSALPPYREDWLLIEPAAGLSVPVQDFRQASHGLSRERKGLLTRKEERRLRGPRLLVFLVIFPVIWGPVTVMNAAVSYAGQWQRMGFWEQLRGVVVLANGRFNPMVLMAFFYVAFAAFWLARLIWVRRRVRQAHFRIPRRDGAPLALPHITPALEQEYLSLSSRAYVIDSTDGRHIRYRQGSRMIRFPYRAPTGDDTRMEVGIPQGASLAWSEPSGEPVDKKQWPQILLRVRNAVKFAGYVPVLNMEAMERDKAAGGGGPMSEPQCG